jgi:uncharacterized membrane protein
MDSEGSLAISCPGCAARMPETAVYCPGCGQPMPAVVPAMRNSGRLPENLAAGLAYFTFVPAIVFLLAEPFKNNRFVRFHSIQCLLLCAVAAVACALLRLAGIVLLLIPVAGPLLIVVIDGVVGLAALLLWLVLVVKALRREMFKLPVLGELAERYSSVVQPPH